MVVTDYHKERTIGNIQKEGTMEFLVRRLWCTSKWSCELRSCDCISTYQSRKKEKCGPSAQERNTYTYINGNIDAYYGSPDVTHMHIIAACREQCSMVCGVPCIASLANCLVQCHFFKELQQCIQVVAHPICIYC